ncbi:hypothetical protein AB0E62_27290 [Streptomyces sp. NPDC038707]|uniref:hypothetical protein n=1 Tax=Streptomyces sp. NPDC038707 TaxID=3154329 RepID=UPI0033CD64BA
MSSLHDHVASNSKYDAQKTAAKALLDAITEQVEAVKKEGGPVDHLSTRLKVLAEVYALVVHGKS